MAGKLLSLDEAAQRLGVSADEVQRLVDRKQLYPVRDGSTLKFKQDEIERHAAEADAVSADGSGLSLDLDLDIGPQAGQADALDIDLGEGLQLDPAASGGATGSAGPIAAAGESAADGGSLGEPLALDDLVGDDAIAAGSAASGPGQPAPAASAGGPDAERNTGTLPIDLSGIAMDSLGGGSGSNATGSITGGSGSGSIELSGMQSNVGSALSGVLEGGVSLEDSDVRKSGILSGDDFAQDMESAIRESGAALSGLAGEPIEEFRVDDEEGSGADDIVGEESGTAGSSFIDDESESFSLDDASSDIALGGAAAGGLDEGSIADGSFVPDADFSKWQVCGLVCCALLMLSGGFVMFDLICTLGSPEDLSLSSRLIDPMSTLFGWR